MLSANNLQGAEDDGDDDESGWQDIEPDVEEGGQGFKSLFDDKWYGDITDLIKRDKEDHGFDYLKLKKQFNLDFLDSIRLINYVRSEVQQGRRLPETWTTASVFSDDQYLQPTMQDDAVLYSLDDINEPALGSSTTRDISDSREQEMRDLQEELAQLKSQFSAYRQEMQLSFQNQIDSIPDESSAAQRTKPQDQDSSYFSSYSHPSIHSSMLKDTIRTDAYRDFVYNNKHLFRGKTVLDVGCGTGILSLFCAKAGAKQVLAVDNSDIIDKARVIVYQNGFSDVITCLRGKIEEVILPVDKVDVIISEWMGYALLYESMLDSVLWARDRYLLDQAAGGLMVPSRATLQIAPLIDSDVRVDQVDFWKDVYGFDMRCMADKDASNSNKSEDGHDAAGDGQELEEALVLSVNKSEVYNSTTATFLDLDLYTIQPSDLNKPSSFKISLPSSSASSSSPHPTTSKSSQHQTQILDGWIIWFDISFSDNITFSTGPHAPQTHWQQVVLLNKQQDFSWREGEVIVGAVGYRKKDWHGEGKSKSEGEGRSVDIEVLWGREAGRGTDDKGKIGEEGTNTYSQEQREVWSLD